MITAHYGRLASGKHGEGKKGDKGDKKTGERLVQLNLKSTPIGIRNTIVSEKLPTKNKELAVRTSLYLVNLSLMS